MNAGTIIGYVTRRDGSPISGAEIRISRADGFGNAGETKPVVKTDSRGYFQLAFSEDGGNLNVSVGAGKSGRTNHKDKAAVENRFQVTGYLIRETLKPHT